MVIDYKKLEGKIFFSGVKNYALKITRDVLDESLHDYRITEPIWFRYFEVFPLFSQWQ